MSFTDQDVTIDGVRFHIDKIPAFRAWHLVEYIRKAIADSDQSSGVGGSQADVDMAMIVKAVAGLPPSQVDHVRKELFEHVRYWDKNIKGGDGVQLAGCEDAAFADIGPLKIYEVMGRALSVNFTESLSGMLSGFGFGKQILSLLQPQTSPNSSQDQ